MRIESSTISMAANRSYTAEALHEAATITRRYEGGEVKSAGVSVSGSNVKYKEVEGGTAMFTSSADGITRTDGNQVNHEYTASKPVKQGGQSAQPQAVPIPQNNHWISSFGRGVYESPETLILRKMLELLERCTGKKLRLDDLARSAERPRTQSASAFRYSASAVSLRYQETVAMLNSGSSEIGDANASAIRLTQGGAVNGYWTHQVVESGFVSGEEHTAFASKGAVVTSDGRTIDFKISMEMSRSFEAAYVSASKEEVYTDPLVINMDTDAAELSDVSFYFDLNCDGTEEKISALNGSSGFLALDKNGDGEINDGSELFGAKTGDGFGELARYDQDGNGWIDEGDDVFSRLTVWTKCGTGEAKQLSLAEADVGAIFLGSQNTRYSLMDGLGETGAMVRKTGIYLKESGGAGTVQHIDFKA